jgi:hypothetical protein
MKEQKTNRKTRDKVTRRVIKHDEKEKSGSSNRSEPLGQGMGKAVYKRHSKMVKSLSVMTTMINVIIHFPFQTSLSLFKLSI